MESILITSWQIDGEKKETVTDSILEDSKITQIVTAAMTLKDTFLCYDQHRQRIKKQRHHFANKGSYSQSYDFSSCHVRM